MGNQISHAAQNGFEQEGQEPRRDDGDGAQREEQVRVSEMCCVRSESPPNTKGHSTGVLLSRLGD